MIGRQKRTVRGVLGGLLALIPRALLVAIFGFGYACRYLDPDAYWWTGPFAVVLPYVAGLLAFVLVLGMALSSSWRRLSGILLLTVIVLMAVRYRGLAQRFLTTGNGAGGMVVLTMNAPKFPDTEEAGQQMASLVSNAAPNVAAFQEGVVWARVNDPDRLRGVKKLSPLVDSLGYTTIPPRLGPPGAKWYYWHQPVVAKEAEVVSQEQIIVDGFPETAAPTRYLRTVLRWDDREFVLYNIHLYTHGAEKPWSNDEFVPSSWSSWKPYIRNLRFGFIRRAKEARWIRERIQEESLPVILCGDFNSPTNNWSYSHLRQGMKDAYELAGQGLGLTYHASRPWVRIDHVLVSDEFEPVHAYIPESHPSLSDHRAVVARIAWRDPVPEAPGSDGEEEKPSQSTTVTATAQSQ